MGKAWNLIFLSLGLMLMLQFAGLPNGAMGSLFTLTGINFNEDYSMAQSTGTSANFFDIVFGSDVSIAGILSVLAAAGAAVIVGLFAKIQGENLILLPFITGTLAMFVSSFLSIINYAVDLHIPWLSAVVSIIFVPIMFGFILALVEMFRGTD